MQWKTDDYIGESGKRTHLEEINTIIDSTINHFFPEHPVYHIFPYFYIGTITKDSDFFHDNETPLSDTLTYNSDDLKTISHLSLYHKNRIAYDPKSVDIMLRCTGKIAWHDSVFSMGIYRKGHCGDSRYSITSSAYFALPETSSKIISFDNEMIVRESYFCGIDIGFDKIGVK